MWRRRIILILSGGLLACSSDQTGSTLEPPVGSGGSWSTTTPLPVARFEAYAAVARGRVHFIGGITGVFGDIRTAQPSRRVDVFDPATNTWTPGPELPADAPKHHLTVTVANDAIYVLGGFDGILGLNGQPFRPIAIAYVLDPNANAWRSIAPPPLARGGATAQAIDNKLFVTGGAPNEGEPSYNELDIYDIATNTWKVATALPTAREHVASCAIDGKMIVVGGWKDAAKISQSAAEQYDPKTDRWTPLPPMFTARGGLGAVAFAGADGVIKCHVVGGEDWALPPPGTFASHEVYDPKTNTWTRDTPMARARHGLGIAWLGGAMYAVGGGDIQGNSYLDVVEVFR